MTAGGLLRAAREEHGLHIAALAAAMKVAPRKLDALENDRWSELPDATFARALALTVCRTLKIDARPVLDLLPPAEIMALRSIGEHLNAPFHGTGGRTDSSVAGLAIRPMVWAAAVLMAAALAVYFVPEGWFKSSPPFMAAAPDHVAAPTAQTSAAPAAELPGSAAATADAAAALLSAGPGAPAATQTVPLTAPPTAPPTAQTAPPNAPPTAPMSLGETVFSAPPAGSLQGAPASGSLQLRTSEPSWVDVRDGRGQVLLSRIVQPGETVGLDGTAPFRLTIGNVAATQLSFRGQPVSLAPNTRDNVARVELQ